MSLNNLPPIFGDEEIEEISVKENKKIPPVQCGEGFKYSWDEGKCVPIKMGPENVETQVSLEDKTTGKSKEFPKEWRLGASKPPEEEDKEKKDEEEEIVEETSFPRFALPEAPEKAEDTTEKEQIEKYLLENPEEIVESKDSNARDYYKYKYSGATHKSPGIRKDGTLDIDDINMELNPYIENIPILNQWLNDNPNATQLEIDDKRKELGFPEDNSYAALKRRKEEKKKEVVVTAGRPRTKDGFYRYTEEEQKLLAQQQQENKISNEFDRVDKNAIQEFNKIAGFDNFLNSDLGEFSLSKFQQDYDKLKIQIPGIRNNILQPIQDKFVEGIIKNNETNFDQKQSEIIDKYNIAELKKNIYDKTIADNKDYIKAKEIETLKKYGIPLVEGEDGKLYLGVDPNEEGVKAKLAQVSKELNIYVNALNNAVAKEDENYLNTIKKAEDELNNYKQSVIDTALDKNFYWKRTQKRLDEHIKEKLQSIEDKREEEEYGSGFTAEVLKWGKLTLPSMANDMEVGNLKNIQENLKKEQKRLQTLDPNTTVYKKVPDYFDPGMGITKLRDEPLKASERLNEIGMMIEANDKKLEEKLINSVEYQKELAFFDRPELFDKDNMTLKDLKSIVGEQGLNVLGSILSLGLYTTAMEGTAAMREILAIEAAKKLKGGMEEFNKLSIAEQAKAMSEVDDAKLGTALAVGLGAGALDFASTLVGAKALVRTMPKGIIKAFIADGFLNPASRKVLKEGLTAGAKTVRTAVAWEIPTEVGQDLISNWGVQSATGEGNILPEKKEFKELVSQTALSTILLVSGGLSVKNNANLLALFRTDKNAYIKSIQNLNKEYNFQKDQIEKGLNPFNDNKPFESNIEKTQADKQLDENLDKGLGKLKRAENFVQNTKFKNLEGKGQEIVYEEYQKLETLGEEKVKAEENLKKVKENKKSTKEEVRKAENAVNEITNEEEISTRKIFAERALQLAKEQNKNLKNNIQLDKDSEVDDINFFDAKNNKELRDYIEKNTYEIDGEIIEGVDLIKRKEGKEILSGDRTGMLVTKVVLDENGKVVKRILESLGSEENYRNAIMKRGDYAAAVYKKHEGMHMLTRSLGFKEGIKMRNQVLNELKNSKDPKMRELYKEVKKRMDQYSGEEGYTGKGSGKAKMDEFFAALQDELFYQKVEDIYLEPKVERTFKKIGDIFASLVKGRTVVDFNKMTPENTLEFIKTYSTGKPGDFIAVKGKGKTTKALASKPKDIDKIYNELRKIDELESNFNITPDSRARREQLQRQLQDEKVQPIYDELQAIDEYESNFNITPESKSRREQLKNKLKNDYQILASKPVKKKLFDEIQSLVPENINTKEDYQKFLNNPRQFNPLYNSITQPDGAINNYIKGVATSPEEFELMVENVQDRVLAFNPEAERKTGDAVGIDAFVERIMSDTRFGKLDARKTLFKEGEKTKVQDKIDKPEAKQIKATETVEPKRQVNLVLPKEIKDAAEISIEPAILAGEKAAKELPANATIKQKQRKIDQAINSIVKNRIDGAIKKGLLNKKNFPNFVDKNWEAIGNAYLNNTDITQLKKPNQLETREILQDWIDNGFTKQDVLDFFTDPSLSPQARSDRKNVGLVRALNKEIVNEAKVELIKRDPKTAAEFKAKTGFALASKPINKKVRDYLAQHPNAPQTLRFNSVKELLKSRGLQLPDFKSKSGIKKFFKDIEPLVLLLPKKMVLLDGFYAKSNRGLFGTAIYNKRADGKKPGTKEEIKRYNELVETFETERNKLKEKIRANKNQMEFTGAAGDGKMSTFINFGGRTLNELISNFKSGKIDANNVKNMAIHKQMWAPIYNAVKNDPDTMLPIVAHIFKISADSAGHWHRMGAELKYYSKNFFGIKPEYEHAMSAKAAYLALLDSAAQNVPFEIAYPAVTKNYKVIALAKVDDNKLIGPYKSGMGEGWNFYTQSWLQRYFNPFVGNNNGGIDPNSIVDFYGRTVKDIFNIESNGLPSKNPTTANILASKPVTKSTLDIEFNKMLERTKGIKAESVYSEARAIKLGALKGWQAFVPYSNEDYMGLVYPTLGKGKQGDADLKWWTDNVMDPYNQGIQNYETAKEAAMQEWKQLKKKLVEDLPVIDKVTGILKKKGVRGFTNEEAVRVYIWDNQNMTPDNLAKKDIREIKKYINKNPKLKAFADRLQTIMPDGYPEPTSGWLVGNISTDLINQIDTVTRKEYLKPWRESIDLIYTKDNVNKLRAIFGDKYVEALDDVLYRMDAGRNRPTGANRVTNLWLNWLNNSVGTTMFFNQRSSLLQTISAINFLNWTDNNPALAAKAFANQPQYWKDFATLFNSDFLKQRRTGLKTDISADEIASAAAKSKNKAVAALNELLKVGFISTQIADSFAIASGGATFYRNRINKYKKEGFSQKEAEEKAFFDFRNIAIDSQQSSDPSRISMQQASQLGRIILSYANTPVQYARLIKKASLDLANRRGDVKTNISKIVYYGALQNIIFTALQSALFGIMFDEDDEEVGEKEAQFKKERKEGAPLRIVNGIVDTLLRGSGVGGAFVAMLKNVLLEIDKQRKKTRPDYTYAADKIFSFSPTIDTKFRKASSAARKFTYKQELEKIREKGIAIDNPALLAAGEIASAAVNIPADRVVKKLNNLKTALEEQTKAWQSIALFWGYGDWELGIQARRTDEARAKAKKEKAKKKELKKDIKKLQKGVDKEKKSPVKDTGGRVLGRANKDGSIEVANGLSPKKKAEVIRHEKLHQKEMQNGSNSFTSGGKLDYNDNFVFYGKKKYARKNGRIKDGNKWKPEGDHSLPWEVFAHKHD